MHSLSNEQLSRVDLQEALRLFRQEIEILPETELNLLGNGGDIIRTPVIKENMKLGFTISSREIDNDMPRGNPGLN